ncbi:MAG TPA: hypothetical protein VHS31_15860 [Tepidisphaeraceae bacterium]|jgi:hypothetical protein|nr:hypothetical protein [Tepidisphaeraceae bacterium]
MNRLGYFGVGITFFFCALIARAQPATAPSTSPATLPARHQVVIPPGFIKVEADERTAICEPADKDWIVKALNDFQPSTRPSTMPSDLVDTFTAKQGEIVNQIAKDFGLTDNSQTQKLFNERVLPDLQKMSDLRPPMFYLVCTRPGLMQLIHAGWSDPRFHYNRVADDVTIYTSVDLSIQRPMDDVLIPAIYDSAKDIPSRQKTFQGQVDRNESNIAASLSMQAMILVQSALVAAIDEAAVKPLNLKPGQEWFAIGVEGLLSSRYLSQIGGMPHESLLRILTEDEPGNPIRSATINLVHPLPIADLKPNYAPAYVDAFRRRAVIVVNQLLSKSPPDALPKLFAAIKKNPPADGDTLVALIQQTIGVDLSKDVLPQ